MLVGDTLYLLPNGYVLHVDRTCFAVYNNDLSRVSMSNWPKKISDFSHCIFQDKVYIAAKNGIYTITDPYNGRYTFVKGPGHDIINISSSPQQIYVQVKRSVLEFDPVAKSYTPVPTIPKIMAFEALDDGSFVFFRRPWWAISIFKYHRLIVLLRPDGSEESTSVLFNKDFAKRPKTYKIGPTSCMFKANLLNTVICDVKRADIFHNTTSKASASGYRYLGKTYEASSKPSDEVLKLNEIDTYKCDDSVPVYVNVPNPCLEA